MSLRVNKKDNNSKINFKKKLSKNNIKRFSAGVMAAVVLFSGAIGLKKKSNKKVEKINYSISQLDENPNKAVEMDIRIKAKIAPLFNKTVNSAITIKDLMSLNKPLSFTVDDKTGSIEWLNYCQNVPSLKIMMKTNDTSMFSKIKKMNSLKSFAIFDYVNIYSQDNLSGTTMLKKDFSFLKESENLEYIKIRNIDVEKGLLEEITQLRELDFSPALYNIKIDFTKMTFLDRLNLSYIKPYNLAIDFTKQDYNFLKSQGVAVSIGDLKQEEKFLNACDELDQIVNDIKFNLNNLDWSDYNKLKEITSYILKNLEYDKDLKNVNNIIFNLQNYNSNENLNKESVNFFNDFIKKLNENIVFSIKQFYKDGYLNDALDDDGYAICGNYAALFNALCTRLNINCFTVTSYNHAWNKIYNSDFMDGYYDICWLDDEVYKITQFNSETEKFEEKNYSADEALNDFYKPNLKWFNQKGELNSIDSSDSHKIVGNPSFINISDIDKNKDNTYNYELKYATYIKIIYEMLIISCIIEASLIKKIIEDEIKRGKQL